MLFLLFNELLTYFHCCILAWKFGSLVILMHIGFEWLYVYLLSSVAIFRYPFNLILDRAFCHSSPISWLFCLLIFTVRCTFMLSPSYPFCQHFRIIQFSYHLFTTCLHLWLFFIIMRLPLGCKLSWYVLILLFKWSFECIPARTEMMRWIQYFYSRKSFLFKILLC